MVFPVAAKLTDPFRAKALPVIATVPLSVMVVSATMLPRNWVPVPSVAELPTQKYTFFAWVPLVRAIAAPVPVVSVDPALITNCALELPCRRA
jgi:hypothetical protein